MRYFHGTTLRNARKASKFGLSGPIYVTPEHGLAILHGIIKVSELGHKDRVAVVHIEVKSSNLQEDPEGYETGHSWIHNEDISPELIIRIETNHQWDKDAKEVPSD